MPNNREAKVSLADVVQGGTQLKRHRKASGKTQEETGIARAQLSRYERGKERPSLGTLLRLVALYGVSDHDRMLLLRLYGYDLPAPRLTDEERRQACESVSSRLESTLYPMYLVDNEQRLLRWNRGAEFLIARGASDPLLVQIRRLAEQGGLTTFDLVFNDQLTGGRIENRDEVARNLVSAAKAELLNYQSSAWYEDVVERLIGPYPLAQRYWISIKVEPSEAYWPMFAVDFWLGSKVACFWIQGTAPGQTLDARFRLVTYTPRDATSASYWNAWITHQ